MRIGHKTVRQFKLTVNCRKALPQSGSGGIAFLERLIPSEESPLPLKEWTFFIQPVRFLLSLSHSSLPNLRKNGLATVTAAVDTVGMAWL